MSWISTTLKQALKEQLKLDEAILDQSLGPCRNPKEGDWTLTSFVASKQAGLKPPELANTWVQQLQSNPLPLVAHVSAKGPYVNFVLDGPQLAEGLLKKIHDDKEHWGHSQEHHGEYVICEFSSPNIAKPFAIHHLRSTLIGASIARILGSQGYDVERINHLGDWGTQFGYVMEAYKRYQDGDDLGDTPLKRLVELYQRINAEADQAAKAGDNSLHESARTWFRKLENGDAEARRLWEWFRDVSIKELEKTYNLMGITFDTYRGEAFYEDKMDDAFRRVEDLGLLVESEGAQVVDLGDDLTPILLRKSDGATLYATRDLAALLDRWERREYTMNIYVVASQQNYHFKQLFALAEKMKLPSTGRNIHVPFGMLRMEDGQLGSTRKGTVLYLDDVIQTACQKAEERLDTSRGDSDIDWKTVAMQVGLGAIYFNDLKAKRVKDITFKWDDVLNFEGRTGAYLQYAQARMQSILDKGKFTARAVETSLLTHEREKDLLTMMDRFSDVIREAAQDLEPNTILNYLFDLVQVYSSLTQDKVEGVKVLCEDAPLRQARLNLVAACRQTLVNGLQLLCIPCPQRM